MGVLFNSLVVYTLTAFLMYICALSSSKKYNGITTSVHDTSLPQGFLWCIIIFSIFAGIRYDVGVDHLEYLDNYLRALRGLDFDRGHNREFEEGYVFITRLFSYLSIHPTIYFGFLAALQIIFVMFAVKEEKRIVPYVMLLIILGGYFFTWMNGIRQMIAACTYLWGAKYISDKKFFPFLLCGVFAYLWHHSSVLFIPFFFFGFSNFVWNKTWINLPVFIVCVVIGLTPTWVGFLNQLAPVLAALGYENYSDMMDQLLDPTNGASFNIGPRFIFTMFSYIFVIYYYPKARVYFTSSLLDIYFKFFFIGCCSYYLFVNVGMIFLRPVLYFTIFALPTTAYILLYLKRTKHYLLFGMLMVLAMSYTYISCFSDSALPMAERKSYLYQFYFFNM